MDFDDIGCFGLPPIDNDNPSSSRRRPSSSAAAASKQKKKGTKNRPLQKMKSGAPKNKRLNHNIHSSDLHEKSRKKRLDNIAKDIGSCSSSDDGDEMALTALARPTHKISSTASLTKKPHAPSLSNNNKKKRSANDNDKRREPPTNKTRKQLGLHSFLVKPPRSSNHKEEASDNKQLYNVSASSSSPSLDEGESNNDIIAASSSSDNSSSTNKNKRHNSFVKASSFMVDDNTMQMQRTHGNTKHQPLKDELEEFSDDDDNDIINDTLEKSTVTNGNVSEDIGNSNLHVKETKEEKQLSSSQIRKHNNRMMFGIHKNIMGHKLPTLDPKKQQHHRTIFNTASSYGRSNVVEQCLLHGKSTTGTNILSHLAQRSYLPSSSRASSNTIQKYIHSGQHYNICNTVQLSTAATSGATEMMNSNQNNTGEICSMSFDTEGILLATGDDRGTIRIYDFDDVYSLDVKKRNELCHVLFQSNEEEEYEDEEEEEEEEKEDGKKESADQDDSRLDTRVEVDSNDNASSPITPSIVCPVLSFQCKARFGGNVGPRISSIAFSTQNQDHLAVSFANQGEVHIYDIASNKSPLPCLRLGDEQQRQSRSEGILKAIFLPSGAKSSTQILAGGDYGTVRLWTIPTPRKRKTSISNINAKCQWSIAVFGSNNGGEGVCDMMTLPSDTIRKQPLVLVSGTGSSLALLDTNKITRKAFSTTVTPTLAATWDLYQLALREYAKIDSEAKLPARRWMAAHKLSLLQRGITRGVSWFQIGIVAKCGWVFTAEISLPGETSSQRQAASNSTISLRLQIVHHTPRVQCFNSLNERITTLGGMANQFSLPDVPVPSSQLDDNGCGAMQNVIWLSDVKETRYTLPSKDKYVLCEDHGTITSQSIQSGNTDLRHRGGGLILADVDTLNEEMSLSNCSSHGRDGQESKISSVYARLPLLHGSPLSLAMHPSSEFLVVGYGMNNAYGCKPIEVVSLRKKLE